MMTQPQVRPTDLRLRAPYDAAWFEMVFMALDRLHDDVSAGTPDNVSPLGPVAMVGWLEEIIYTDRKSTRLNSSH